MKIEDVAEVLLLVALMFASVGVALMVVEYRVIQWVLKTIVEMYYSLPLSGRFLFIGVLTMGSGFIALFVYMVLDEIYEYVKNRWLNRR